MCTAIVDVADALPLQPEMEIRESTVVLSGIATSVPLVTGLHPVGGGGGGGGVMTLPTLSSRLGEPAPGFVTLFGVEAASIVFHTWAGVAVGVALRIRAAAPTTCGVAIDVPLIVLVAVLLEFQADVISCPGAKMSVQVP